jgi:hypothetical protein
MKAKMIISKDDLSLNGCPACNGGATLWEQIKTTTIPSKWLVRCDVCKLEGTSMVDMHQAVRLWNSREGINFNTLSEGTTKRRSGTGSNKKGKK